jgi:hypothetical protein
MQRPRVILREGLNDPALTGMPPALDVRIGPHHDRAGKILGPHPKRPAAANAEFDQVYRLIPKIAKKTIFRCH